MTPTPALIEADAIGRRAPGDGAWLLHDVSLSVAPGERVSVSGPSGAGKTLLLRALSLLDAIDAGSILWRGEPVAPESVPTFRSRVIYLHQQPSIFPGDVEDNLRRPYDLAVHEDRSWDRTDAVQRLDRIGRVETFLDKRATDLSGGEAQIVAFLRALQLEPDVLLLDEPTAALDARAAQAIEALVDAWYREDPTGRALVWVSHDEDQSRRATDRAVRLEAGWVAA